MEYEWGILRCGRDGVSVHRTGMTQLEAQEWLDQLYVDGPIRPGAFVLGRRSVGAWTDVDEQIRLEISEPEGLVSALQTVINDAWPQIDPSAADEIVRTVMPVISRHVAASLTLCEEMRQAAHQYATEGWDAASMWASKWDELRERISRATTTIGDLIPRRGSEHHRLMGKLDGVKLVSSYVAEYDRPDCR